jgi:hypothetical protein
MEKLPHPLDQDGLAATPDDVRFECDPANCRFDEPFMDRQHVYHPRCEFKTPTEKKFRNLSRFVIKMCRCQHEHWDNDYQPPPKPPLEVMRLAIERYSNGS